MTLRLSPEDDAALEAFARASGISKHEAVVQSIRSAVERELQSRLVEELGRQARDKYASLLQRLAQ